jgi:AcrR family transcriptional regulator
MADKKTDRRIQRTRQLLSDALVSLILEKGYQKITVQDIIDRANVGRSTFYAHFRDKDDLLVSGFDYLAHDLNQYTQTHFPTDVESDHLIHSLEFFTHAQDKRELYLAMTECGSADLVLEVGRQHIQNQIQAHLGKFPRIEPKIPLPVIINFLATSLLSMVTWWLAQDTAYTPEEMDEMFNALTMPGVWEVLGVEQEER